MSSPPDFTEQEFAELLTLAQQKYRFVSYRNIPWSDRFVLWRHDVDFSLNRATVLARIENAHGVQSTFFINIHSEFYNAHERSQTGKIHELLDLGHEIGLHLDTAWLRHRTGQEVWPEDQLNTLVDREAQVLEGLTGIACSAVSFHNPSPVDLTYVAETYGGLVNCYSQQLRDAATYCSDSFGYWRFTPLREVLELANAPALQVLTHPGNWQAAAMSPRQRLFRCVYERADSLIRDHDNSMLIHAGQRFSGDSLALDLVRDIVGSEEISLLDQLWSRQQLGLLILRLQSLLLEVQTADEARSTDYRTFFGVEGNDDPEEWSSSAEAFSPLPAGFSGDDRLMASYAIELCEAIRSLANQQV